MGESEDLQADRTNICFTNVEAEGKGRDPVKLAKAEGRARERVGLP